METGTESKIHLPEGFLLGAATSAHQTEGNNMNSDWWHYEQQGKLPRSGEACDHYNRFEEDFEMAKNIGLNAMRISIEWARIEPVEGKWEPVAIEHYRKVLKKMKQEGLTRMVTLHHFSLPLWLAEKGGFESDAGIESFSRYAWFVAQNLGDEVDLWCTINEPEVYSLMGYYRGMWPPFTKSVLDYIRVYRNFIRIHIAAYEAIKQVKPDAKIGLAKNNTYNQPYRRKNFFDRLLCKAADYFGNRYFLDKTAKHLDFIGLNYYFYKSLKLGLNGWNVMNDQTLPKSDMGWSTYPQGIYHLLKDLGRYKKPVYITENGIANATDDMRKDFIEQHLRWTQKAIEEGVDVRGYFYWSLIDNYEWHDGFTRYFGLAEVNYETQERKIRPSAEIFKQITNT
jgi:beta-glucosidase